MADKAYQTKTARPLYVYGNVVPKPVYEPEFPADESKEQKSVSHRLKQNRKQVMHMNKAYLMFLTAAAILALVVCVNYIQLRSDLVTRSNRITLLQKQVVSMREENTTKYNVVMDSVNLEEVREKAMNELGMVYADSSQIVEYDNPSAGYVKQFEEIPEEGILTDSLDVKN